MDSGLPKRGHGLADQKKDHQKSTSGALDMSRLDQSVKEIASDNAPTFKFESTTKSASLKSSGDERLQSSSEAHSDIDPPTTPVRRPGEASPSESKFFSNSSATWSKSVGPASSSLEPDALTFVPRQFSHFDGVVLEILDRGRLYGKGLFAATRIEAGTPILQEAPIMVLPDNRKHLTIAPYSALSPEQKKTFDSLSYQPGDTSFENEARMNLPDEVALEMENKEIDAIVDDHVRIMCIFATNNFQLDGSKYGLFNKISRVNHGCVPNAKASWDAASGTQTVRAVKTIYPGDEIRFCYLGSPATYMTKQQRGEQMRFNYGFDCGCSLCDADPQSIANSDARRLELTNLTKAIRTFTTDGPGSAPGVPETAEEAYAKMSDIILTMIREELITYDLLVAYQAAVELSMATQRFTIARYYAVMLGRVQWMYDGVKNSGGSNDQLFQKIQTAMAKTKIGMSGNQLKAWSKLHEGKYQRTRTHSPGLIMIERRLGLDTKNKYSH